MVIRARLLRAQGDPDHARLTLQRAAALAREMDDPWLQAQVVVTLAELEEGAGRLDQAATESESGLGMARSLSDARLTARAERVLGRVQFRQGRRKEALIHLANCVQTLQRSGAQIDAARAALDYVVAMHGAPDAAPNNTIKMLDYAVDVLDRMGSPVDRQIARSVARHVGHESIAASRQP
jgi:ATP/maltotriose-dependent transcriptional regulator MalT